MSGTITGVVDLDGGTLALDGVTIAGAEFAGPGTVATSGVVTVNGGELLCSPWSSSRAPCESIRPGDGTTWQATNELDSRDPEDRT